MSSGQLSGGAETRITDQAAHAGDKERMMAESLSTVSSIRSVVCVAQEKDTWHLLITHDSDDLASVVDQAVDKIMEVEDEASAPILEPLFVHASEPERRLPAGAKTILKR